MPNVRPKSDNVVAFPKQSENRTRKRCFLAEDIDLRLGEEAAEDLRSVLQREIDVASLRWARNGELLPRCVPAALEDTPVFSASEACARVALQEAIRSMFWECGEPIPKSDMPIRIVRLQEEFSASLRQILKDLGYV